MGACGAVFGVPGAEYDSGYARHGGCTCAHRTRLESHDQCAVGQSPLADGSGSLTKSEYLRVRGWVSDGLALVACTSDDLAIRVQDDRADWEIRCDTWRSWTHCFIKSDAHRGDISG